MMASPWRQAIVRPEVRDQCEHGGAEAEEDGEQCRTADGQPGGSDALWIQALDDGDGNKHTPHHVIPAHDDGPEPVDTERPAEDGVAHAYRIEDRLERQSLFDEGERKTQQCDTPPVHAKPARHLTDQNHASTVEEQDADDAQRLTEVAQPQRCPENLTDERCQQKEHHAG
jgi:hypothetical protein